MQLRTPHARLLAILALAGLGAPLVALAIGGLFSRYAADDYCTAGQVQLAGFVEAQSRLYVGWSGRFAATLLVTLVELIGPAAVPLLPGLALLAWFGSMTWAIREVLSAIEFRDARRSAPGGVAEPRTHVGDAGRRTWLAAALLATLVMYATLATTSDLPQVLYWQTGLLTYLAPLLLATLFVGWLAHVSRSGAVRWPVALGVCFGLTFLAGGTSETFAAGQVTALALVAVIAHVSRAATYPSPRPSARAGRGSPHVLAQGTLAMLAVGLVGATLAMMLMAAAPGNSVRQETGAQTPLAIALPRALEFTQGWLRLTFARPHSAVLLLLVGVPAAIRATSPRPESASPRWRRLAVGVAVTFLVILACMLPAFYALGTNPPGRAQVVPQFVLVCSLAALGWVVGGVAGAYVGPIMRVQAACWVAAGGLVVLLALGPLRSVREVLDDIPPARAYATAWDQLDGEVRAARHQGVQDVTVRPLASTGLVQNLDFVGPNRADWFNTCVARYYDLNTIASTLSVP